MPRNRNVRVSLSSFNIEEQIREFRRIQQERDDLEFARQLQQENAPPPEAPAAGLEEIPDDSDDSDDSDVEGTELENEINQILAFIGAEREDESSRSITPGTESSVQETIPQNLRVSPTSSSNSHITGPIRARNNQQRSEEQRMAAGRTASQTLPSRNSRVPGSSTASSFFNLPNSDGSNNDCCLCFETPREVRGCNKCLQLIGCKNCVMSWFRRSERPSCPLCRNSWRTGPNICTLHTLRRLRSQRRLGSAV